MVGGPFKLDIIRLVCCLSLLVCDRILCAYMPLDMPLGRLAAMLFMSDDIEAADGVGVRVGSG